MSEGKYRLDVDRNEDGTLGISAFVRKPKDDDGMWRFLEWFPAADEAQAYVNELKAIDAQVAERARTAARMARKRTVGER